MVSDADVWRTNSVTMPATIAESVTKLRTSSETSMKPSPRVSIVRTEETAVSIGAVTSGERDDRSDLPRDIPLHPVRHLDQPLPGTLDKRNHLLDLTVVGQLQLEPVGPAGLARDTLLLRILFRQRRIDLRRRRGRLALVQLVLQLHALGVETQM